MSLFNIFNVAGSAMSAQSQRLNVVSSNIANADSATSADGKTYRAKQVVFAAVPTANAASAGVKVQQVVEDASPLKKVYDPKHPQADENGYVSMPNVRIAFLSDQCGNDEHGQEHVVEDIDPRSVMKGQCDG